MMDLLYHVTQTLQLRSIDSGPTYIHFFNDKACQNASFVVHTETNVGDGQCGSLTGDGVNSVNLTTLYPGCSVTTYIGPWCTNNKTELFLGTCTSISAGSYSVDCPALNGTINGTYTTSSAASSSTVAGSLLSSTSDTPTFFPQEDSTTTETSTFPSDTATSSPTTSGEAASSTPTSSSFAASSSVQLPTLSTTGFQSPTSSAASSSLSSTSSSQANTGSSTSGGNKHIKIIVPSVVVPVFIIFVIACVIWRWKSLKSSRGAIKDEDDKERSVDPRPLAEAAIQPSQEQSKAHSSYVTTTPASDMESIASQFSSLPKYPQARLKNRTAEPDPFEE